MGHYPRLMLLAILVIASMAAAFYTWRTRDALEGFDEEEAHAIIADGGSNYDKRMYVMKLFDALLKRKATSAELDEFSKLGSDTDILSAVISRYKLAIDTLGSKGAGGGTEETGDGEKVKVHVQTQAHAQAQASEQTSTDSVDAKKPASGTEQVCLSKTELVNSLKEINERVSKFQELINSM